MTMLKKLVAISILIFCLMINGETKFANEVIDEALTKEQELIPITILFKDQINEQLLTSYSIKVERSYDFLPAVTVMVPKPIIDVIKVNESIQNIIYEQPIKVLSQVEDWGISKTRVNKTWEAGYTGQGIDVAVLDTGVSTHSDLNIKGGVSFLENSTSYHDDNGHGTHVTGIINAQNNTIGTRGVAPNANVYSLKILDSQGYGTTFDLAAAIEWSIQNKMDIINLSFGYLNEDPVIKELLDTAYNNGILVVAAAGNNVEEVMYPARHASVISVGAVDEMNLKADFSPTSNEIELVAPGVGIISTYLNNEYSIISGTSMATPYVTGILALLKEANPTLGAVELRSLLQKTVLDLGVPGKDQEFGLGLAQSLDFPDQHSVFNPSDKYFKAIARTAIYVKINDKLVRSGAVDDNQEYPRIRDYGDWHEIKFGNGVGYVKKEYTRQTSGENIKNLNTTFKNSSLKIIPNKNIAVYDNTSGRLVQFGSLYKGVEYPIISDIGAWLRVDLSGRIGFIKESDVKYVFPSTAKYFEVLTRTAIYEKKDNQLVRVGAVDAGQEYPIIRHYGNWLEIKFGNGIGYVNKLYTKPSSGSRIKNLNTTIKNSKVFVSPLVNIAVYDNTSGSLVQYASLYKGVKYPIINDIGSWLRVDVAGRIGFIREKDVQQVFTSDVLFFEVNTRTAVYQKINGSLIRVGAVDAGQEYPRIRDYGSWHEVKFGNGVGYVKKEYTKPSFGTNINNLNTGPSTYTKLVNPVVNIAVYDNTSGSLVQFGSLYTGFPYPIIQDIGSWLRIDLFGRVGYINEKFVK
ncbi:hypothetical protein JOC85_002408 [Bacillus mesophilus]|uniref:S8 family peptidase n=1 Tax=Bacillus mesophilus TaxID=1808955 RepID=A0A6M0Q7G9_9BACI|nr:S8 family peptidase [Bacillus mesophilus]MBM7661605.1 hypothetical protein [Bacillus mesophilus]NEY72274.1 S8 family peptidase [Bacillus mesophilus]